jgi:hypothetical protein
MGFRGCKGDKCHTLEFACGPCRRKTSPSSHHEATLMSSKHRKHKKIATNKPKSKKLKTGKVPVENKADEPPAPNPEGIPGLEAPWLKDPLRNPALHPSLEKLKQDEAFVRRYPMAPTPRFDKEGELWGSRSEPESVPNIQRRPGPKSPVNEYYFLHESELSTLQGTAKEHRVSSRTSTRTQHRYSSSLDL